MSKLTRWYTKGAVPPIEVEMLGSPGLNVWNVRLGDDIWEEEERYLFYDKQTALYAYAQWLEQVAEYLADLADLPFASLVSVRGDVSARLALAYSRLDKGR